MIHVGKKWKNDGEYYADVAHVASVAGSCLKWLERMTEEQAQASLREKSNPDEMTLEALHSA